MQIILSPAKLMNFDIKAEKIEPAQPLFPETTAKLVETCRKLSVKDIVQQMEINKDMAHEVYGYFQSHDFDTTPQRSAALAYNGIAYKGLNAHDFSEADVAFAQQHLNILSGLYGILRPLDLIKPYRLEMGRKITPKGYKTLYEVWQDTLAGYLSEKLLAENSDTIINVASKEYAKVIKKSKLPKGTRIIEMIFLQQENDRLKQIVVHTKKARGLMSRFIIKNKLTDPEDVKAFDTEDYFFYPKLSKEDSWTFVR